MTINRLVFPGFWFDKTPVEDALKLARMGVGGFCFYGGNKQLVMDLSRKLRAASTHRRILIAADYEDGLGRWLADTPLLPSNMALGAADNTQLAFEKGYLTASQARVLGVDWVFSPVVDLADNPDNPIINTRSFGKDPQRVIALAEAFMRGLSKGGILNCLKHFPGHGNTNVDSHLALPVMKSSKEELKHALQPFQKLLPLADSVMAGHLLVPMLDKKNPASLSSVLLHDLLQEQMGFRKCICTDALSMKALGDEKQAALSALHAGANILLVPEKPFELLEFLNHANVPEKLISKSLQILNELCAQAEELAATAYQQAINVDEYMTAAARQAIVVQGNLPQPEAGEEVHYLSVGNDEKIVESPFLETLSAHGLQVTPFTKGPVELLVVLFWRRYQAFKGKIALSEEELIQIRQAVSQAKEAVVICFANPWTSKALPPQASILTFSPAPAFQQAAAECLLGKIQPTGKLPIEL